MKDMIKLGKKLFPICRSLTGNGNLRTLKIIKSKMAFFPHMPIWLVKERLEPLEKKLNYEIFNNFHKFAVIRNPFDVVVSAYYWHNKPKTPITFEQILYRLEKIHETIENNKGE